MDSVKVITILFVSAQGLLKEGLLTLLRSQRDFHIAGVESTGLDAARVAARLQPHVVLIDADLPRNAQDHLLRSLPAASPGSRAMLLFRGLDPTEAVRAIQTGVRGLVNTSASSAQVFKSIRTVMAGEYWVSRGLVSALARTVANGTAPNGAVAPSFDLTPREREVLALVAGGGTNKDAAQQLELSVETVKHHLTSIFDKTGVSTRLELAMFALAHGLIEASPVGESNTEPRRQAL